MKACSDIHLIKTCLCYWRNKRQNSNKRLLKIWSWSWYLDKCSI